MFLDAADTIADGKAAAALAIASGVYTRLAALEMLLYPSAATTGGLLGTVTAKIGSLFGAGRRQEQAGAGEQPEHGAVRLGARADRPGAGHRPDRDRDASTTALLNPTHAEVQITLRVLTADELDRDQDALAASPRPPTRTPQGLRQALAVANLANAAESVVGMLPI